jgi:Fur family transcriptional regulator, peroxide stress response regulator
MKIHRKLSFDNKNREFESACKDHGLALTIQRRAILESLATRTDHPTADQVYDDIREKLKGVSRTTVYRVLDTLVSIGVAKRISNPDSKARFDADTSRHHHLTCIKCGLVLDLHDLLYNDLQQPSGFESEFDIVDYSITFTGFCARCRRPESKPEN